MRRQTRFSGQLVVPFRQTLTLGGQILRLFADDLHVNANFAQLTLPLSRLFIFGALCSCGVFVGHCEILVEGGGVFIGGHRPESIVAEAVWEDSNLRDAAVRTRDATSAFASIVLAGKVSPGHFIRSMLWHQVKRIGPRKTCEITYLFGVIMRVERTTSRVRACPRRATRPIFANDLTNPVNGNNAVIELIAYWRLTVRETDRLRGQRRRIATNLCVGHV